MDRRVGRKKAQRGGNGDRASKAPIGARASWVAAIIPLRLLAANSIRLDESRPEVGAALRRDGSEGWPQKGARGWKGRPGVEGAYRRAGELGRSDNPSCAFSRLTQSGWMNRGPR